MHGLLFEHGTAENRAVLKLQGLVRGLVLRGLVRVVRVLLSSLPLWVQTATHASPERESNLLVS